MYPSLLLATALITSLVGAQAPQPPPPSCRPARPTPSKPTVCNKKGSLKNPSSFSDTNPIYSAANSQTLSACARACNNVLACQSFSFDSTAAAGSKCVFYNKTIKAQKFQPSASSTVAFYDLKCYKCDRCKVTLANGGFETGSVSPWVPSDNAIAPTKIVTPGADSSQYAFELTSPNEQFNNQATIDQGFNWCAGVTYNISFKVKGDGFGVLYIATEDTDGNTDFFAQYTSDASGFSTNTYSFTPATDEGYISLSSISGSSLIFDSITITPA